jgi:hypothetical protein
MFKGISVQQFNRCFKNEDDCKQYLFDLKWKKGYRRRKCDCTKNYKGRGGRKVRKSRLKPVIDWEIELENMGIFPFSGREKQFGEQEFEISLSPPRRGRRFPGMIVVVMNLRGWMRGIHHHCSERFVNGYLDEFFFRFNARNSLRSLWHQLIEQYMTKPPYRYMASAA